MRRTTMQPERCVFPLYRRGVAFGERQIGTAFQALRKGILLTAAHALEEGKETGGVFIRARNEARETVDVDAELLTREHGTDIAALAVAWPREVETQTLKCGWPEGSTPSLAMDVVIPGYANLPGESAELRAFRSYVQKREGREGRSYLEFPLPAFKGLSGSPVLFHDWGVTNGLEYVIGVVLEAKIYREEESGTFASWTRALGFDQAAEACERTLQTMDEALRDSTRDR